MVLQVRRRHRQEKEKQTEWLERVSGRKQETKGEDTGRLERNERWTDRENER